MTKINYKEFDKKPSLSHLWEVCLSNLLDPYYDSTFEPTLFISKETLNESKYLDHFPHQLLTSSGINSSDKEFITPATCLHVYPQLKNKQVEKIATFGVGSCARYEDGKYQKPYRLPTFRMAELVIISDKDEIFRKIEELTNFIKTTFDNFGIKGEFKAATDAFFLGQSEGAQIIQQLKNLKQEFVVKDVGTEVALVSINNHEDFFGRQFNIRDGEIFSNSLCLAFGIERLTAYSMKTWGDDLKKWPSEFKKYAHIS